MSNLSPGAAVRRSPVYRKLEGAEYRLIAGERQASTIQDRDWQAALIDFSLMPRFGVRGSGAADHLAEQRFDVPVAINTATPGRRGSWVARLGKTEYWVLGATDEEQFPAEMRGLAGPETDCYPVPCDEGRAWFVLHHPCRAEVMAKLCGVDLREAACPLGSIAQTSVARVNAVIIHHTVFKKPVFSLFSDVSSSSYLWGALVDALEEFGAGPGALDDIF